MSSFVKRSLLVWLLVLLALAPAKSQAPFKTPPLSRLTGAKSIPRPDLLKPFRTADRPPPDRLLLVRGRLKSTRHPLVIPPPKTTRRYQSAFIVLLRNPETTDRYDELILKYAALNGLDPRLLKSIISAESQFNPKALSPAGARGLMQLMPRTADSLGVPAGRLYDPEDNIRAGSAYLKQLFSIIWKRHKLKGVGYQDAPLWVVQRVIASYHAGPRFLHKERWFRSTRLYVRKVLLFYQSRVTDIRRFPETMPTDPGFRLVRNSAGAYN